MQSNTSSPNVVRFGTPSGVTYSQSPQRCHRASPHTRGANGGQFFADNVPHPGGHQQGFVHLPFAAGGGLPVRRSLTQPGADRSASAHSSPPSMHMSVASNAGKFVADSQPPPLPEGQQQGLVHLPLATGNEMPIRRSLTPPGAGRYAAAYISPTAMHMAVADGCLEAVRRLCAVGRDCDAVDGSGMTPLHVACEAGHFAIARFLCSEAGAKTDVADKRGASPLHICAAKGHVEMVELLCEVGANKDIMDFGGATPLYVASHVGHLEVVSCLLEAGCSAALCAGNGVTALAAATRQGHRDVARLLRKADAWPRLAPRTTCVHPPSKPERIAL